MPLHEVLGKRIFEPQALARTQLRHPDDTVSVAGGHASGKPVVLSDGYATPYAAGALASTSADLVRFWHALLSGDVVASATLHAMFSRMPAMSDAGQSFYGLGVQLYDIPYGPGLMLGHSGGIAGFTSVVAYVANDDVYVAVLLNDKDVPAEAGLWAVVRAIRAFRAARVPTDR